MLRYLKVSGCFNCKLSIIHSSKSYFDILNKIVCIIARSCCYVNAPSFTSCRSYRQTISYVHVCACVCETNFSNLHVQIIIQKFDYSLLETFLRLRAALFGDRIPVGEEDILQQFRPALGPNQPL
jgi:hypothetical protein